MPTAGRRRSQLAILQGDEKTVTMRLHRQPSANFPWFAFVHGTTTRFKSTPRRVITNHTIITNTITFSQSIIHNSSRETRAEARCFHSGLNFLRAGWGRRRLAVVTVGKGLRVADADGGTPSLPAGISDYGRRSQLVLNLVKMFGDFGEVRNFAPDFNGIRFKVRKIIRRDGG